MNSCELVSSITAIACALSNRCSRDELTILSVAFSQLGDTLTTILAQEEICENRNNKSNNDVDTDTHTNTDTDTDTAVDTSV